jgi:hypothetical protein
MRQEGNVGGLQTPQNAMEYRRGEIRENNGGHLRHLISSDEKVAPTFKVKLGATLFALIF